MHISHSNFQNITGSSHEIAVDKSHSQFDSHSVSSSIFKNCQNVLCGFIFDHNRAKKFSSFNSTYSHIHNFLKPETYSETQTETSSFDSDSFFSCSSENAGGAIHLSKQSSLTVNNCVFDSCSSTVRAGAIYYTSTDYYTEFKVSLSNFTYCSAEMFAGAIESSSGRFDFFSDRFLSCSALPSDSSSSLTTCGGAMLLTIRESDPSSKLYNLYFQRCKSTSGGGVYFYVYLSSLSFSYITFDSCSAATGGAIALYGNQSVTFSHTVFTKNSATDHGNDVFSKMQGTLKFNDSFDVCSTTNTAESVYYLDQLYFPMNDRTDATGYDPKIVIDSSDDNNSKTPKFNYKVFIYLGIVIAILAVMAVFIICCCRVHKN